jgi:hypothetical protein
MVTSSTIFCSLLAFMYFSLSFLIAVPSTHTHPETRFIATFVPPPCTWIQTEGTLVSRTEVTRCGGLKVKSGHSAVICCWRLATGTCFRRSLWFYCMYSLSGGARGDCATNW